MMLNNARTKGERLRLLLPSMLADMNEGLREREHTLSCSFVVTLIILGSLAAAVVGAFVLLRQ